MSQSSKSINNQNIAVALVILFLGLLLPSMIRKSKTTWDKTSSSFLFSTQNENNASPSQEDSFPDLDKTVNRREYKSLWNLERISEIEDETIHIDSNSIFMQYSNTGSQPFDGPSGDDILTAQPPDKTATANNPALEPAPEFSVQDPPNQKILVTFSDTPNQQQAELLAPPLDSPKPQESANSLPDSPQESQTESVAADQSQDNNIKENTADSPSPLVTQNPADPVKNSKYADLLTPLPRDGENSESAASAASTDDKNQTVTSARPVSPQNDTAQPNMSNSPGGSHSAQQSDEQETVSSEEEWKLTQSGTRSTTVNKPSADIETTSNDNQVSAAANDSSGETPDIVANNKVPSSLSLTRIDLYTAGANETWNSIVQKFDLTESEAAEFAKTNESRINSDGTITEGMKLMLPKR